MQDLEAFLINRFNGAQKLCILGAGSFMKADDAAGVLITEKLLEEFDVLNHPNLLILSGESAPENCCGEIKRFSPDHLCVIDAADMGESPGSIVFIENEVISGVTFSTHMLPVKIMLDYLVKETGCKITVMGIQPVDLTYDGKVTQKVAETVEYVTQVLSRLCEIGY